MSENTSGLSITGSNHYCNECRLLLRRPMVTFDNTKTSADDLVKVTINAGYPSTVVNN